MWFWIEGEESFFKTLLFSQPFFTPSNSLLVLNHFIGDDFALLQRVPLGNQLIQRKSCTMEGFFYLPTCFDRSLNMLSDRLRNFIFVLLSHLNQGVEFIEMDTRLNGSLDGSNPSLKLLLFCTFETFQMLSYSTSHLSVTKFERFMTSIFVVVEIVRKQYEKFCSDIIVSHLMKKLHCFCSDTIS